MRRGRQSTSILEVFIDPLFGAFGAFLFIFLMVILMIGIRGSKPIILTEKLPDAFHGEVYKAWLSAHGGVGDYEWTLPSAQELPPGLSLDLNGYLSGVPEITDTSMVEEEYEFDVIVTALRLKVENPEDAKEKHKYKIIVHRDKPIEPTTLSPVKILTTTPLPDGTIGKAYNVTLSASGGLPPYTWKCEQPLLANMTFNETSGAISGVPNTEIEAMQLTFSISDARVMKTADSQDSRTLELSIFPPPKEPPPPPPPPEIITQSLPQAIEGIQYEVGISVLNGAQPFTWTAESTPEWLKLDTKTGMLRGTPPWASTGKVTVSLALKDALDRECVNPFSGEVEIRPQTGAPIKKLSVLSKELPTAIVKNKYYSPIALSGGVPPFHFSSDSLPKSLTITEEGIIQGLPDVIAKVSFEVDVKDSYDPPQEATASLTLEVREQEQPLRILTESKLPDARIGRPYDIALSAVGGNGIYKWTTKSKLPKGLSIVNGRLKGKPIAESRKRAKFDITVKSAGSIPVTREFDVAIMAKDKPSLRTPKWLWLAVIFVINGIAKKIWNSWCITNAKKYGTPTWVQN